MNLNQGRCRHIIIHPDLDKWGPQCYGGNNKWPQIRSVIKLMADLEILSSDQG